MSGSLRAGLVGFFAVIGFSVIVLGSFSIALTEGAVIPNTITLQTSSITPTPPKERPTPALTQAEITQTMVPRVITATMDQAISSPTHTSTIQPCPMPAGWIPYIIQSGDTLAKIAQKYMVDSDQLMRSNCLKSTNLLPGTILYVPPLVTNTPKPTVEVSDTPSPVFTPTVYICVPRQPYGWSIYIIQYGDTLYTIAQTHGTSVNELIRVNCLATTNIRAGDKLYVPYVASRTNTVTATEIPPSPLPTITKTQTKPAFTVTKTTSTGITSTNTPTRTATTAVAPTRTPTPTATSTP
ncbi:MAG TPA: LysM peptidoglycan-binding domain-containing protein [Anaerolineaceae bacterium]